MNLNTLKIFTTTLFVLGSFCFPGMVLNAQNIQDAKNNPLNSNSEVKRVDDELNLYADKVNIKHELAAFDSLLLKMQMEEEDAYPSDDIYGAWSQEYVKAYADLSIPDSFRIDVSSFIMPAEGRVTSKYGPRRRRFHYGTDVKVQTGDTIRAAFDGKIRVKKYERRGYGYYLVLRHHNGLETVYGHLSKYLVEQDQTVKAGEPIALGGNTGRSTGSHLHLEFRFLGQPINPAEIVDFENFCTHDDTYVFRKKTSGRASNKYTASGEVKYHRVKEGDTLSRIAKRYGVSINALCRLNGIKQTSTLRIGQSIRYS
jgi:Membrane proteins related to metalloendopeptidases